MFNLCGAVDRGGGGHPKPRPTVKDGSVLTSDNMARDTKQEAAQEKYSVVQFREG